MDEDKDPAAREAGDSIGQLVLPFSLFASARWRLVSARLLRSTKCAMFVAEDLDSATS